MAKDINDRPFDECTQLKLDLFREFFREWISVFAYNQSVSKIYVYDLFAGSGQDPLGHPGSPRILIQEARGKNFQYCGAFGRNGENKVKFAFNELLPGKEKELEVNVNKELSSCKNDCPHLQCPFEKSVSFNQVSFEEILKNENFIKIMRNPKYAKFLLLDQYGYKEISDDVFKELIAYPKTDVLFYISSSNIKRFKNMPAVQKYLAIASDDYDGTKTREAHRVILNHYKSLVPNGHEYYLHGFTIKRDSNYWGVVFGSSHSYGMEKFVRVCWDHDEYSGDSNCMIDNNWGELFLKESCKRTRIKEEIKSRILTGEIATNIQGMKFALHNGCLPKFFHEVVAEMLKEDEISVKGDFNRAASKIHAVKEYSIILPNMRG